MRKSVGGIVFLAAMAAMSFETAYADPMNVGPPAGAILDLNGQAIAGGYVEYSVDFTATLSSTDITFALRNDPSFTYLTGISVVDDTNPGGNLILNGNFDLGPQGTSYAQDWTYLNQYGATYGGVSEDGAWVDGAVQAYDAIDQFIATTSGDTYTISFYVEGEGDPYYSDLSTNGDVTDTGGNGNDVLVYAQAGAPVLPEPSSLALLGSAFAALAGVSAFRRRKTAKA